MKVSEYGIGGFDPSKPNNNIIAEYDIPDPPPRSLNETGALATLLTVVGLLDINDASNAVGLTPDDLIAEAEAWAAAKEQNGSSI